MTNNNNNLIDLYKDNTDIELNDKKTSFNINGINYTIVVNIDELTLKKSNFRINELLGLGAHYVREANNGENKIYASFYNSMSVINKTKKESDVLISIDEIISADFVDGKKVNNK